MLHALAAHRGASSFQPANVELREFQTKAFNNLFANRDKLNAYTRALLALSAHNFGYADKAKDAD